MNKIEYALRLAKDCTFADEMTEGPKQHLRNVIDEALNEALHKPDVSGSLPVANPHHCPECSWQCTCSNQPCSCCQGNDR